MARVDALNLQTGDEVGGYTLIAPLGGGSMGSVWRARDDGGVEYAMKILRDSLAEDATGATDGQALAERTSARERLRREAMALRRIDHPGVCGIVDMELDDSLAFIVTELIEGLNLRDDVAANGAYRGDDLERLAQRLAEAVGAVHQAGIVHRDIKPTNVMISAAGPVLVDFGIAMGQGESHVTRTGLVMGTPGFIAPEVIDGAESDEGSDWWSTAAVLAYAACGRPVFGSKPMMAVLERAASGSADLTGLPARTMAAFRAALAPRRQDRPSPEALLDAIATDAMDPQAWQGLDETDGGEDQPNGTDSRGTEEPAETTVPFDACSSVDRRPTGRLESGRTETPNPRAIWREQEDEGRTRTLYSPEDPAVTAPLPGTTRPLPNYKDERGPGMGGEEWGPEDGYTAPLEGTSPLTAATRPLPPINAAQIPLAGATPRIEPENGRMDAPSASAQVGGPYAQDAPAQPALVRWEDRQRRGGPVLWLIGLLLAMFAALAPAAALLTSALVLWGLSTTGLNRGAQISRELKRGGGRKTRDTAFSLASLPWQTLKAFVMALPRCLLLLAIDALGMGLGGWLLGAPRVMGRIRLPGLDAPLPLIGGTASSVTGLLAALCALTGWLVCVFAGGGRRPCDPIAGPGMHDWTVAVRLGAGSLAGSSAREEAAATILQSAGEGGAVGDQLPGRTAAKRGRRRAFILLGLWALALTVLLAFALGGPAVDWTPLTVTHQPV
ncbi:serine/threonine-protein kinase [Bifidobacterium xylocopae]|uniref:non-specific serine/threonine protein kinase n=2 Tax=Bifidobacterium TaxID=1678 RepID=A0A366KEL6_9BIFI|nr:serine/threonine-protein kinase [Bifidobacterium xylocopae]RBP99682.1 serine/threonine protein kinase [Bifidobacterium xylocopae]